MAKLRSFEDIMFAMRIFRKVLKQEVAYLSYDDPMSDAVGFHPDPDYGPSRERLTKVMNRLGITKADVEWYFRNAAELEAKNNPQPWYIPQAYNEQVEFDVIMFQGGN